jgi:2-polyprenyl-6-hydroxyphenyl methylase/3-demethylubiquinone-9 3-methyltransferase
MANNDRISEVYKGEIWASASQQRARRRIDWLVEVAEGDVVDVGCSQGITSILLARRGHTVVGIDVEESRVEYAEADRLAEPPEVRDRLSFRHTDGERFPLPDASVDTALLGEVIEHLEDPGAVLREIVRVLRPDGRLVLTTPFGYSPHHDHHHTFYLSSGLDVVAPWLTVDDLSVEEGYLRLIAHPGPMSREVRDRLILGAQDVFEAFTERAEIEAREARAVAPLRARLRALEDQARADRLRGVARAFDTPARRNGHPPRRAGVPALAHLDWTDDGDEQ